MAIKLPILEQEKSRFAEFLKPEENKRIIFSGIYGSGKTTFLTDFFEDSPKETEDRYEVIRIVPTHYSVSSNEDIFRLIKHDILIELLNKGIDLNTIDLKNEHYLYLYLKKHPAKLIADLIQAVTEAGKDLDKRFSYFDIVLKFGKKLGESLKKSRREVVTESDENTIVDSFMDEVAKKPTTPFEDNLVLHLISEKLELLRKNGKKTILVIDDLDRLDPEHIFRILNIFAAQFESIKGVHENRFGFDKIIVVCDIDNIKEIFHHKYGQNVNFYGYLDKFCSSHIFYFSSDHIILEQLEDIITSINVKNIGSEKKLSLNNKSNIFFVLSSLLIKNKFISLRSIIKFSKNSSPINWPERIKINEHSTIVSGHPFIAHIAVLGMVMGSYKSLGDAIIKSDIPDLFQEESDTEFDSELEAVFKLFLFFSKIDSHKLLLYTKPQNLDLLDGTTQTTFHFTILNPDRGGFGIAKLSVLKNRLPVAHKPEIKAWLPEVVRLAVQNLEKYVPI